MSDSFLQWLNKNSPIVFLSNGEVLYGEASEKHKLKYGDPSKGFIAENVLPDELFQN